MLTANDPDNKPWGLFTACELSLTVDATAQDEAEQRRCIEMAASQLRLVLEGQRPPRGSIYQPPSKLGAGGPPQVLVALSCSSCRNCHRIAPAYTLWLWLRSVSA